ncbi:hypothetical protein TNCV_4858581 [Trichonephila clavipes]|nr:hypothetical protein TNCV_4858581 [Trichonephila clavipes]
MFINAFAARGYSKKPWGRKSSREVGEGEEGEAPDLPPGCSPSKLGWNRAKLRCHLYSAQGYGQRQAYI